MGRRDSPTRADRFGGGSRSIQVIMHGVTRPSAPGLGSMPAFKNSLNNTQAEELVQYIRKRFAPTQPAWTNLDSRIESIRQQAGHL